ncbi:MAG: hypothetical protein MZU84_05385 [Sphingobacterium sp.]|nr:hypothetical protein [Sphingobacterium sp.]
MAGVAARRRASALLLRGGRRPGGRVCTVTLLVLAAVTLAQGWWQGQSALAASWVCCWRWRAVMRSGWPDTGVVCARWRWSVWRPGTPCRPCCCCWRSWRSGGGWQPGWRPPISETDAEQVRPAVRPGAGASAVDSLAAGC